jgi:hypothetical protein
MANPKIVYDPGSGPVTLNFQYPPRRVPAYAFEAVRHDNVASSGVRESVTERVDQFLTLELEWILNGADVAAWSAFMQYALAGGQFSYYPDASQAAFTNYWLEDTQSVARYKAPGKYALSVKFRQAVVG